METEKWRFYAEMIGIIAVVASLIALIAELRQTQSAVQAATYQARAFDAIQLNHELQDSEYILPLLTAVNVRDPEQVSALSDIDRARLVVFFNGRRVDADNEYYQYQFGYLDEEHFEHGLKPFIRRNAPNWRALGVPEGRPSFTAFVDTVLADESGRDN